MRIGICDDSEQSRQIVANWLKSRPDVLDNKVYEFGSGAALLEYLRRSTLDIVIMDCLMEGMDGIETANEIRRHDSRLVIIMVTDYRDYAIYGYGAGALDYILKEKFTIQIDAVFDKAIKRIKDLSSKTFTVKTTTGLIHLEISEILYIESHLRKMELITYAGQAYVFYSRITDVEMDLKKHGFIRPHNSYIVNSKYVKNISQSWIWLRGLEKPLPISKGKYIQI
jgi:DNA-binding LytR/AlgR family response regulator